MASLVVRTWGVIKRSRFVFWTRSLSTLNNPPISGKSPSNGIFFTRVSLSSRINPPMTTVAPPGIEITVLTSRVAVVGVSPLTIYNWELGKSRPRKELLASLVAVRGIGKQEAQAKLELLKADEKKVASKTRRARRKK